MLRLKPINDIYVCMYIYIYYNFRMGVVYIDCQKKKTKTINFNFFLQDEQLSLFLLTQDVPGVMGLPHTKLLQQQFLYLTFGLIIFLIILIIQLL